MRFENKSDFFCITMEDLMRENKPLKLVNGLTFENIYNIIPGVVKLHANFWKKDILTESWIDPSGKK